MELSLQDYDSAPGDVSRHEEIDGQARALTPCGPVVSLASPRENQGHRAAEECTESGMAPPGCAPEPVHAESWLRKHHLRPLAVENLEGQAGMVRAPCCLDSQE